MVMEKRLQCKTTKITNLMTAISPHQSETKSCNLY